MMSPVGKLFAMLVGAVLLASCASTTPVQPVGPAGTQTRPAPSSDASLEDARRAAGIADCPVSDAEVAARDDGLPDVTLDCLGGGTPVRLAGLRGQPMLINIWAQWCGPCRTEAPFLREAAAERDDVLVLGIDFDDPDPAAAIDFAEQAQWGWPQVADPDKVVAPPLRVLGPPHSVLVDADGRIVHTHIGPFTSTEQLVGLLAEHFPE